MRITEIRFGPAFRRKGEQRERSTLGALKLQSSAAMMIQPGVRFEIPATSRKNDSSPIRI
jgi:hypothetical protein